MSGLKTPAHIRFHTLILLVPTPNTFLYLSYLSLRWNIRLVARLWLYLITTLSKTEGLWASSEAGAATVLGTGLTASCLENAEFRFFMFLWSLRLASEIDDFPLNGYVAVWISLGACSRECEVDVVCGRRRWKWFQAFLFTSGAHCEKTKFPVDPSCADMMPDDMYKPICAHTYTQMQYM